MSFVKKWLGCIVSFIAGVCGLALSACTGMVALSKVDGSALSETMVGDTSQTLYKETTKAFKVLTDGDLYTKSKDLGIGSEFMAMKVFAIITLVISVLLIVYAIVMLLKNLNVIKCDSKIFDYVGLGLIALLLIATIGLIVSSNAYANAMEDALTTVTKMQFSAKFTAQLTALGLDQTTISSLLDMHKFSTSVKIGAYQPIMLTIAIISAIAVSVFTFIKTKKA